MHTAYAWGAVSDVRGALWFIVLCRVVGSEKSRLTTAIRQVTD